LVRDNYLDTWDPQWFFAIGQNEGLSIAPRRNLVSNIGCGDGTHIGDNARFDPAANLPIFAMEFPLIHPSVVEENMIADNYEEKQITKHYFLKKRLREFGLFDICKKIYRFYQSV
jgi:hypothetical protein